MSREGDPAGSGTRATGCVGSFQLVRGLIPCLAGWMFSNWLGLISHAEEPYCNSRLPKSGGGRWNHDEGGAKELGGNYNQRKKI